jgi:replicative DNA helicase
MTTPPPQPLTDAMCEASVIGMMIMDPACIPVVKDKLRGPEDFATGLHADAYRAIVKVYDAAGDLDLAAVSGAMRDNGWGDDVTDSLISIAESVPGVSATIDYHANRVASLAVARRLDTACFDARRRLVSGSIQDVREGLSRAIADAEGKPESCHTHIAAAGRSVLEEIKSGRVQSFPLGLPPVDRMTGGIPIGWISTVVGLSASGKSTLWIQAGLQAAKHGLGVLDFSYEQDAQARSVNAMQMLGQVSLGRSRRTGKPLSDDDFARAENAVDALASINYNVVDRCMNVREIYEYTARQTRNGIKCIIVDYLQSLPPTRDRQTGTETLMEAMQVLQRLRRELGITILAVSQIDKESAKENKMPTLKSGMGSIYIHQFSDFGIGVHCPWQYENPNDWAADAWVERKKYAEIGVVKDKAGGNSIIPVRFEGKWTKWMDAEQRASTGDWRTAGEQT